VTDGSTEPASSLISLGLAIPTDERYLETVRDVASRVAEYVGFAKAEAATMGQSINETVAGFVRLSSPPDVRNSINLNFVTDCGDFEVRIHYRTLAEGRPAPTPRSLEDALRRNGAGGTLDSIQRVMDRVEFGEEDGVAFCRLIRRLPAA
jgi:anti-sigma regulatory factor (Ser/Thr protein kinase)